MRLPRDFQLFLFALVLTASALVWTLSSDIRWQAWPELLMFMVMIMMASMLPIPYPRGGYRTATTTLMYVLLSVHAPGAALLAAGSAYAIGRAISGGWVPWKTLSNGAQMGISVALAGLAFRATGGSPAQPGILSLLLPLAFASLVHQATNNLFVTYFYTRLRRTPFLSAWLADLKDFLWPNLLSVPTAALLAIVYVFVHPATLFLYLLFLPVQRWAVQLYLQQKQIYKQAIESLVIAVDANFPQGAGHSRRVADVATAIARQMKLPDPDVEAIELGALLHDVGIIGLDELLGQELLSEQTDLGKFRQHVAVGAQVVKEIPHRDINEIVLNHHESFDGSGYLRGLKGTEIPIGARIVAVAEAFDSMTSGGFPYSERVPPQRAVEEIRLQAGKAFDPEVVNAFLSAMKENSGFWQTLEDRQRVTSVPLSHG